jgi:hypothetical protein
MAALLGAPPPWFPPEIHPVEGANRRIVNRRMREELGVTLRYPSFMEGLMASMDA